MKGIFIDFLFVYTRNVSFGGEDVILNYSQMTKEIFLRHLIGFLHLFH